jgi:parvulin-like peptidyl-prolyl isomerase
VFKRAFLSPGTVLVVGLGLVLSLPAVGCRRSPAPGSPGTAGEKPSSRKTLQRSEADSWRVAGSFILVSHVEAPAKGPKITRGRPEALARIREARVRLTASGAPFEDVAKEFSDAPGVASDGGFLGILTRKDVRPSYKEIAEPLFRMRVGEVSEIFEVPAGYAIVKRLPPEERAAAHIWIQFAGTEGSGSGVTRTREEALKLAQEVLGKARRPGARFNDLVQQYSEDNKNFKEIGGLMGIFTPRSLAGGPTRALGEALFRLEPGEVSDVVESPYGFHILSLLPLEKCRVAGSQILVPYKGCKDAGPDVTRTKEEARSTAETALARILGQGSSFETVARQVSEHPSASEGGFLGYITKGQWPKAAEDAFFALEPGEVSGVLDTEQGFRILWRWE